jgi:tetratricopeptide (TPR) repeat protein
MRAIGKFGILAIAGALSLGMAGILLTGAPCALGQDANAGASKQPYTMAEYNAYTAAASEKNPVTQIKLLDDFVSKYPNSALLVYVYPLYYQAYFAQKNYPRVIEYADKTLALGDKLDATAKYNALYAHVAAYNAIISDPANANTAAKDAVMAKAAQAAAVGALQALDQLKKPDNVAQDAFDTQKKQLQIFLNGVAAQAAMIQKDYPDAITYYKADLALKPDDPIMEYKMGLADLASTPPQTLDGFWSIARGAASKSATAKQTTELKAYLRKLVANYQQAACDNLTDAELNELLTLAAASPDRPDSYKLPSATDLDAARKDMTIASVITDLKAGGDKAKVTWLASCGLEFPDVPGKIIEVTPGTDLTEIKVAFVTSDAEFDAATTPNMDVKVVGQADAARLEKDNPVRFTATLASFDPDPAFMLHWEKGKVNEEDIPKEKGKKPVRRKPS